jgi:hypothetical protein
MKTRLVTHLSLAALAGAAIIALSATPSSAFTLSATAATPFSAAHVDKVWWRHHRHCWWHHGHRHCEW